jgi:hypothetical protein
MPKMKRLVLLMSIIIFAGCNDPKSFGVGPWPVYTEPAPLQFSPDEQTTLQSFSREYPDLFKRLQGQSHAYRAIVQEHNKHAKEMNQRQLKALGFDEESLRKTMEP